MAAQFSTWTVSRRCNPFFTIYSSLPPSGMAAFS